MKNLLCLILTLLTCAGGVWAKESEAQTKTKLQSCLKSMKQLEGKVKPLEWMGIPMAKRTREQDKEMTRRVELIDTTIEKEVRPLLKELNNTEVPGKWQSAKNAGEKFLEWMQAKLELQNAGVNNPSLDVLKKNEPLRYKEYQDAYKKAEDDLKK